MESQTAASFKRLQGGCQWPNAAAQAPLDHAKAPARNSRAKQTHRLALDTQARLVIVPDILTPAELEQIRKGTAASW
jgi:hypothetical protein